MQSGPHKEAAVSDDSGTRVLRKGHEETFGAARDAIMERLLRAMLQKAIEELGSPEAIAEQALRYVDDDHATLRDAVTIIQKRLIERIVRQATEEIADAQAAARQAQDPIQTDSPKPARKSYIKTQVVEAQSPSSSDAARQPESPPSPPQRQRRKAANGYTADEEALPPTEPAERREEAIVIGQYVYGIVGSDYGPGLTDALAKADIEMPHTPYLLPYASVTAIVGAVSQASVDPKDERWQDEVRCIQERILDQVNIASVAALPMYTPTMHTSRAHLEKALAKYAETLHDALEALAEHQEWNVKMFCNPVKIQAEIETRDAAIETFLQRFAAAADLWSDAGGDAELEAMREGLETPLPEIIHTLLNNCQHYSHRTLQRVSLDSRLAPASEDSVFGNNRMVLNASYLIEKPHGAVFRSALEHLATRYEKLGLVYYIGGPHPPCRFGLSDVPTL